MIETLRDLSLRVFWFFEGLWQDDSMTSFGMWCTSFLVLILYTCFPWLFLSCLPLVSSLHLFPEVQSKLIYYLTGCRLHQGNDSGIPFVIETTYHPTVFFLCLSGLSRSFEARACECILSFQPCSLLIPNPLWYTFTLSSQKLAKCGKTDICSVWMVRSLCQVHFSPYRKSELVIIHQLHFSKSFLYTQYLLSDDIDICMVHPVSSLVVNHPHNILGVVGCFTQWPQTRVCW